MWTMLHPGGLLHGVPSRVRRPQIPRLAMLERMPKRRRLWFVKKANDDQHSCAEPPEAPPGAAQTSCHTNSLQC